MEKVWVSYLFSLSRYLAKCVIKSLFRQLMTSNFKIYIWSTSKVIADRGKRGEGASTKVWISREQKVLFRWNKNIFISFWKAIVRWEIQIWWKIMDASFKLAFVFSQFSRWNIWLNLYKRFLSKYVGYDFMHLLLAFIYHRYWIKKSSSYSFFYY